MNAQIATASEEQAETLIATSNSLKEIIAEFNFY
jgi:hypothetical protein